MGDRLKDRVAIVVGAARGIGAGIAERFVEEGASVADRRHRGERRQGDRGTASASSAHALSSKADISEKSGAEAIVDAALETFGRVDILVQNAGIYPWTLIENISPEEWDRVLAVNLQGHVPRRAGGLDADEGAALWPHGLHVVDHRPARVHAPATATIRRRRPASTASSAPRRSSSPPYGITVNGVEPGNILTEAMKPQRGAEFIAQHGGDDPARPARHAARRRERRPLSSPPTTPNTSPARPSSSMAARRCRRAAIFGIGPS